MRAALQALLLIVPAMISCAPTVAPHDGSAPGRQAGRAPATKVDSLVVITSDDSWQLVPLAAARVDSLREAGVILEQEVDERPDILTGPQLHYSPQARRQCITGRVIVQAIVGIDGRAEASSVGLRRSRDPRLDREALRYMREASFKPGKVKGVTVRTLVNIPIDFKIRGAC